MFFNNSVRILKVCDSKCLSFRKIYKDLLRYLIEKYLQSLKNFFFLIEKNLGRFFYENINFLIFSIIFNFFIMKRFIKYVFEKYKVSIISFFFMFQ